MIVSLEPELLERLTRLDDPRATAVAEELDDDLAAAVRRTVFMRRLFYAAVLIVAQASAPSATDAVVSAARARIADGYDYPWLDTDLDGPPAERHDPQPWEGR